VRATKTAAESQSAVTFAAVVGPLGGIGRRRSDGASERRERGQRRPRLVRRGPARRGEVLYRSSVGCPRSARRFTVVTRRSRHVATTNSPTDRPTDRTSIPSNNDTVRRSLAAAAISSYCRGPGKIIYGHGGAAAASTSRSRAGNTQIICGPSASVDRPAMMRFDRARLARTRGPTRPSDGLIAAAVSSLQPGPASRIVSYSIP